MQVLTLELCWGTTIKTFNKSFLNPDSEKVSLIGLLVNMYKLLNLLQKKRIKMCSNEGLLFEIAKNQIIITKKEREY